MDDFHFKGFMPNDDLKIEAEQALDRITERAPSDVRVVGVMERLGELFHCSIEIGSGSFPVIVETSHKFPRTALIKAEQAVMRRYDLCLNLRSMPEQRSFANPGMMRAFRKSE